MAVPQQKTTTTILNAIARHARQEPGKAAVTEITGDTTLTYGELVRAAQAFAARRPRVDRRIIALPPSAALLTAVLGTWWASGTAVVVDPRAPRAERDSLIARLSDVSDVENMEEVEEVDVASLLSGAPREPVDAPNLTGAPAVILTTSGTSGVPKLVPLTHENLWASFVQTNQRLPFGPGERVITGLPAFHIAGLNLTLLQPLAAGAHVLVQSRFEPRGFVEAALDWQATRTNLVPRMADMLVNAFPGGADLSAVTVSCGGSALYAPTADAFRARFHSPLRPGYGLTETCSLTHHVTLEDSLDEGVVGLPLPGTEHRVVDEGGREVVAGAVGEVYVRGPQVTTGYLGLEPFENGWLRTGDLGRIDGRGRLAIVGRRSELIDYNAHLISPGELENHLLAHPAVRDAAVVGRISPTHGEIPVGVVVLEREVPLQELFEFVGARVAPHKRLHGLAVVNEIPRTPSGKPLRRELRDSDLRIVRP